MKCFSHPPCGLLKTLLVMISACEEAPSARGVSCKLQVAWSSGKGAVDVDVGACMMPCGCVDMHQGGRHRLS